MGLEGLLTRDSFWKNRVSYTIGNSSRGLRPIKPAPRVSSPSSPSGEPSGSATILVPDGKRKAWSTSPLTPLQADLLAILAAERPTRFTARDLAERLQLLDVQNALRGLVFKHKVGRARMKVHDGEKLVTYFWAL